MAAFGAAFVRQPRVIAGAARSPRKSSSLHPLNNKGPSLRRRVPLGDHGPDVKELQLVVDKTLRERGFRSRTIKADREFGEKTQTQTACHFTGWLLGFSPNQLKRIGAGTVTAYADAVFIGEQARSDAMKKRERERRQGIKECPCSEEGVPDCGPG
jgi:hypothetical protein